MKITELTLKPEILKAIDEMGYKELTPVQEKVLPLLFAGKDAEVEAPTGTGKTACYSLPLLNRLTPNGFVNGLVVCPTRELAIQVVKEIGKYAKYLNGVKTVAIYGGQNANYQINALKNLPSIAVGTPGRILDLVARKKLNLSHVNYLVLDECDEMLDMGFIRDIDKVISNIKEAHQTSLFSATISSEIKKISKKYLSPSFVEVKIERDLSHQHQIEQKYVKVVETEKKDAIVGLLNSLSFSRAFVFCRTKHKVMQIAKILKANTNHSITSLQGNLSQNKRDQAMRDFRNYDCNVMVATDIAARGIDVSDVDVVVNYDVPEQDEFYLHRIGRTGRVEAKGTSFTFLTKTQMPLIKKYEGMSKNPLSEYVLNKEGNTIIMNKYLESLAPLLNVSKDKALEEIQEACKEYSEKEGRVVLPNSLR
jgi:ATP-dependent RNA helicase DeaD